MANSFFKFKQFTIHQENCSLKVGTDACILGAWFAEKSKLYERALDIGAGTGLLMLMLAQKNTGIVDGIEIEPDCFGQMRENILRSAWSKRCSAIQGDVRVHDFAERYDFIITNPPFYENQLASPDTGINLARHDSGLTLAELSEVIQRQLTPKGSFGILLPYWRTAEMEALAHTCGFYMLEKVSVRHSSLHAFFRVILHFGRSKPEICKQEILNIRGEDAQYSEEFKKLLNDYYLYL